MAAALIHKKTGKEIQTTHGAPPGHPCSKGVLSPAVKNRKEGQEFVPVPDLHAVYRRQTVKSNSRLQGPFVNEVKRTSADSPTNVDGIMKAPFAKRRRIKKAILIGITYRFNRSLDTKNANASSVQRWYDVLVRQFGFISSEIWILTDFPEFGRNGKAHVTDATNDNIRKAMDWLVDDVTVEDQLFFAFCGVAFSSPKEFSMAPSDWPKGEILDYQLENMVKRLDKKMTLVMFIDCTKSWQFMQLPHIYLPFKYGRRKEFQLERKNAPDSWSVPDLKDLDHTVLSATSRRELERTREKLERNTNRYEERIARYAATAAVVCFGACPIDYSRVSRISSITEATVKQLKPGQYVNAAVDSIESLISDMEPVTVRNLMFAMARRLAPDGYLRQVPQVCVTREIDLDQVIPLF